MRIVKISIIAIACLVGQITVAQNRGKIEAPTDIKELLDESTDDEEENGTQEDITTMLSSTVNEQEQTEELPTSVGNNFAVPSEFNSLLDSLVYSYYSKHAHSGNCKKKGENVEYSDKEYAERLKSLPYEVEMPFNNSVKAFINLYTERKRKQVEYMLGLGKYYFPIFEDVLNKYGIPIEFKYLPIIESALNATAVSRAGAAGLWQFMPSTGRMFGLEVNSLIDERRDPLKSTHAAARYIKELYRIYHDWHLAIAAYNCGPGTINKAIRRSGGKRNFWEIYPWLPRETRSYVPIFIAANYVMNYYEKHNLCPEKIDIPVNTDTILIRERVPFSEIAKAIQISEEELTILNPQYRRKVIPGNSKKYYLRLPGHYISTFIENEDSIYARSQRNTIATPKEVLNVENNRDSHRDEEGRFKIHRVKKGETLSSIARRYRVRMNDIKKWNHLKGNNIRVGQKLKIKRR